MYVRWKRKPLKRRSAQGADPDVSLSAVIVENIRVGGKPRQRYVKHLGAIPERNITLGGWPVGFWQDVDAALDSLKLSDEELVRIVGMVAARVPRPVRDDASEIVRAEAILARGRR